MKLTKELYDRECNKNIVCLIYIIEKKSQLSELSFIEEILEEQQDKPLRFFYSPRLPKFEDALMIADRSNPKMVGIWDSIQSYKVYNGANQKSEVDAFLAKIMERRTWVKMSEKIVDVIFSKSTS